MTTLLAHAFMARDTIREALNIPAAVVYSSKNDFIDSEGRKSGVIRIVAALGRSDNLYLSIYRPDPTKEHISCIARIGDNPRSFRFSRNNLIGYLGLPHVPTALTLLPGYGPDWTLQQLQDRTDFEWDSPGGPKKRPKSNEIFMTGRLHPRSTVADDALRNPDPYPRYKVFSSRGQGATPWTYARVHPNGRDLDPHGPMFSTPHEAREAAEFDALKLGHLPVDMDTQDANGGYVHVLMWKSTYTKQLNSTQHVHTAMLSNSQTLSITHDEQVPFEERHPDPGSIDDLLDATYAVSLCGFDGSENASTRYFDHMNEAMHAALTMITRIHTEVHW